MKKSQFRTHILYRLGWPKVKIELDKEHLDLAITETIGKYKNFATGKATEEQFFTVPVSAGVTVYELPEYIQSVTNIDESASGKSGNFGLDVAEWTSSSYGSHYLGIQPGHHQLNTFYDVVKSVDLIDINYMQGWLADLANYSISKYHISFHDLDKTIWILPAPEESFYLLLRVFASVSEEKLYDQDWVQKRATAGAKLILGEIRSKYSGINLPGGGTLNGERLISEAKEDIRELDENLIEEEAFFGLGIDFD